MPMLEMRPLNSCRLVKNKLSYLLIVSFIGLELCNSIVGDVAVLTKTVTLKELSAIFWQPFLHVQLVYDIYVYDH